MTDYVADRIQIPILGFGKDDFGADIVWFYDAPEVLPSSVGSPVLKQIVQSRFGRDELIQIWGGLVIGGVKYFKLGEGGWRDSPEYEQQLPDGDGGAAYSGTLERLPIVRSSVTISGALTPSGQVSVVDDGNGNLLNAEIQVNVGTINYKTGAYSFTFSRVIDVGNGISAMYKWRGEISDPLEQDVDQGDGTTGPYTTSLTGVPLLPGSVSVSDWQGQILSDDGNGSLVGDGSGTVNYQTGAISVTFTSTIPVGQWIRASYKSVRIAKIPREGKTDLESESDSKLYTFQKNFGDDVQFGGVGSGKLECNILLDTTEGNDDGEGNSPVYYEGGIFSDNDVMLAYFTMPGFEKNSGNQIDFDADLMVPGF